MNLTSSRIPELDGLRAIAIGLVIVFHTTLNALPQSTFLRNLTLFGWSGVDLFFVLSGFLIGGILIDNRESSSYYRTFYARRFFRIVPIYSLLVIAFLACWMFGGQLRQWLSESANPPMPWYAYFTFTNNLWIAIHDNMDVFLAVSWSLAIEEQFYLTLPLVVRKLDPCRLPLVIIGVIASVIAFRSLACGLGWVTQNQAYVSPWFRIDSLMIGVGCALLVRNARLFAALKARAWLLYLAVTGLATLLIFIGTSLPPIGAPPSTPLMTFGLTIVALFYASLMLLAIAQPAHVIARLLRRSWVRAVGTVSYFVYLVHETVLRFTVRFVGLRLSGRWLVPGLWVAALIAMILVVGIARLSWNFFEAPLIRFGHRFRYHMEPAPQAFSAFPAANSAEPSASRSAA